MKRIWLGAILALFFVTLLIILVVFVTRTAKTVEAAKQVEATPVNPSSERVEDPKEKTEEKEEKEEEDEIYPQLEHTSRFILEDTNITQVNGIHHEIGNEMVNDLYRIYLVKNTSQFRAAKPWDRWMVDVADDFDDQINAEHETYFFAETHFSGAFAHWMFEVAIYIPLFQILKEKIPHLKFAVSLNEDTPPRRYKQQIFQHMGLALSDVVTTLPTTPYSAIFVSPINCLNDVKSTPLYQQQLQTFLTLFEDRLPAEFNRTNTNLLYDYVVMPRQKTENLRVLEDCDLTQIIEHLSKQEPALKVRVLHTDKIKTLAEQLTILSQARHIILIDGSSFLVNGIFCHGKEISALSHSVTLWQGTAFGKYATVMNHIFVRNQDQVFFCVTDQDWIDKKFTPRPQALLDKIREVVQV